MHKLSPINPYRLEKILVFLGFGKVRQKGSHAFYKHPDGRTTTIAFHSSREIGAIMLNMILKEIKTSRENFEKLRREV